MRLSDIQAHHRNAGRCCSLKWLLAATALAVLSAWPHATSALQVIEARDGVAIEAILSIKEATRIRIEGAPITEVFGSIQANNCGPAASAPTASTTVALISPAGQPGGEIVLECDRDKGEIYVRPLGDTGKPVNLFVSSARATYTLILRRADTPADTIVIRDPAQRTALVSPGAGSAMGMGGTGTSATPAGPSANHIRTMKALLVVMATDRLPPDVRAEEINRPLQLWAEARLALLRRYEGRGLVGEKYQLRNISPAPMVLAEQEFDRPDGSHGGNGGQVLGVAIEHHNLQPGETTTVYVIRRGGQP